MFRDGARLLVWGLAALGSLCVLLLVMLAAGAPAGWSGSASAGRHRSGWGAVSVAARGPVSSALGAVASGYRVRRVAGGLVAVNQAQGLRARFGLGGVSVAGGGRRLGLRLATIGYRGVRGPVGSAAPVASGNRVVYAHRGLSEWYANGPLGLEQGFTVARPRDGGGGRLTLSMALSGDLRAAVGGGGRAMTLDWGGRALLAYRDLVASDAHGRGLRSWLEFHGGRLEIRVDTRGAAYPVSIDPLIQTAKLTASDGAANDHLGSGVAVSADGSTVVAGAPYTTVGGHSGQGAAYVFTRPAAGWSSGTQTVKLTASDGAANDQLGYAVGVSADGSTVVAGAYGATVGGHSGQGAAYVFTKPAAGWTSGTETAKLTASDGAANDVLGLSVGVSADGSTVLAGAPYAAVGGHSQQGAAYVFTRPAAGWTSGTQTAKLTASDGAASDRLGFSVGVSGDGSTAVGGAYGATVGGHSGQGAAYVFTRPAAGWTSGTETAKLTASDGAAGDGFGIGVGVSANGSAVVAGASYAASGAAYVFTMPAAGWSSGTEAAKLTASDTGSSLDYLGYSVGVSGDASTVVAGAYGATVDGNSSQGAAYVFTRPAAGWTSGHETAKLTASDGAAGDGLGLAVGVSADGSTVVGGAAGATVGGNLYQGAAYVFGKARPALSVSAPALGTTSSAIAASSVSGALSGGSSPTGAIRFVVFGPRSSPPASCTTGGMTVGLAPVAGNGTYRPSAGFTPAAAGDYWWYASYGGDSYNNPAVSACGSSMPETVVGAPHTAPRPATISRLRVSPNTVSRSGRSVGARCVRPSARNKHHKRCQRAIRLRISYVLDASATVTFTITRDVPGRNVKGKCVKSTHRNAKHKRCTRLLPVRGKLVKAGKTGANRFTFTGRISGHALPPGTYRLTATTSGGTHRSTVFRIRR